MFWLNDIAGKAKVVAIPEDTYHIFKGDLGSYEEYLGKAKGATLEEAVTSFLKDKKGYHKNGKTFTDTNGLRVYGRIVK